VAEFLSEYPFDFVIGSVHYLDDWDFDSIENVAEFEKRGVDKVYQDYLALLKQAASSGLFDIVGHFDVVKKFGHRPQLDLTEELSEVLKAVKAHDLCVEVNTSGLRKPVHEIYPQREILQLARALDIPIILGSDAHAPEEVGKDFDVAVRILRQVGYDSLSIFEKRKKKTVVI